MADVIRMPLLSDTMTEGKIAKWHKQVGDKVRSDDVLADIETDKATMEVMGYVDGVLLHIGVPEGKAAKINEIIAIVGKENEDISALLVEPPQQQTIKQENKVEPPINPKIEIPKDLTIVRMPLLSDTMKEGKIIAWHKQIGDILKSDDVIADVETDKATMEVIGYAEGTLLYKGVEAGSAAKINDVIAIIGKAGTDVTPYLSSLNENVEHKPTEQIQPQLNSVTNNNITETITPQEGHAENRIKASPLAKKMASDKGINLDQLHGSGDGGRIVKRDIVEAKIIFTTPTIQTSQTTDSSENYVDIPLTQMRKIIAQRLAESKSSAPHFYLKISVEMDNLISARAQINTVSPVKISINDILIKACALSLTKHPVVNSSWMGEAIRENKYYSIGSAVALPEGLIVPVIKYANQKSLAQIANDANELYNKARTNKLQPSEFSGSTFTISNLGMMDIDEFTAIINPPNACILAVGKTTPTPVVDEGKVVIKQMMKLTLSCDHRVVDGAEGARFLQTLKGYLQNPISLLV